MRRTILSAVALACTAVLASTAPAFADDPTPTPSAPATSAPATATPSPTAAPSEAPTPSASVPAPAAEPSEAPADGQVSVVPEGGADTGTAAPSSSGSDAGLIGAGAGAGLLAGGAALFVVRRRRAATGA
ncbi:Tat pathway signal sequence domain protein [Streptomyces sp. AC602_WCS936]|uniref:Tat pathway signal sequence domain protein n=1 Tax=Streptomyces sp. AC602_WCS936 TaxID=2823685 RepID=UPI001C2691EF|nr:Tat pathway signal sequence domain protein [Streptomyces sp. AC602_WCS936]